MLAHLDSAISAEAALTLTNRYEADHRIANSLQLISALVRQRARKGSVSNPQAFLLEVADRIETVGSLHRFLAQAPTGQVRLDEYLDEICSRLTGALAVSATSLSVDCPPDWLPANRALSLALITAELISNSLKYAHPAGLPVKISLSCRRDGDDLAMVYEDDGVGFPEEFDTARADHTGMRFIEMLSKGLGGDPEWHSDSLGVRFTMTAPIRV
jgi:two-component sensor histidine kinase